MYQNYVVEIKKLRSGEFEHEIYWLYDDDEDTAQLKAESKYHEVLMRAALSDTETHAAIIFTSDGLPLQNKCYEHPIEEAEDE